MLFSALFVALVFLYRNWLQQVGSCISSLVREFLGIVWVVYFRVLVTILKIRQPRYKIDERRAQDLCHHYDAIILGSGFCGNVLGTVLSKVGLSVLIIDVVHHPRSAIGESTVPKTTININRLSSYFNVPELCDLTKYAFVNVSEFRKFPKAYFTFYECRSSERSTICMPVGDPDTHCKREVLDEYLASVSSKYGCHHFIGSYSFDSESSTIVLDEIEQRISADYIFDATGRRKLLTNHVTGTDVTTALLDTRAAWLRISYEQMDFQCFEEEFVVRERIPSYWCSTHHLILDEGWIWVIPLDAQEISVGFVLKCSLSTTSFEKNLTHIYEKYPKIKRLFMGTMFVGQNVVTRDHLQSIANRMRRGKVILTPFSMGFNDPLFSNGLTLISSWVWRVGLIFQVYAESCRRGLHPYAVSFVNASIDHFGQSVREGLMHNDRLIAAIYSCFASWEKFCHSLVLWQVATTFYELSDTHDHNVFDFFGLGNDWLRDCTQRIFNGGEFTQSDLKIMFDFMAEGRFESSPQAMIQIERREKTIYLYDLGFYLPKFFFTRDLDYKLRTILDSCLFWKADYKFHSFLLHQLGHDPRISKKAPPTL